MSQSSSDDSSTPRRRFIGELAVGAAALAAAACTPAATASTAPTPAPAPGGGQGNANAQAPRQTPPPMPDAWDTSWMGRISAKHRAVFDSPEIEEGTALYHAQSYLKSVKDVFGTGDDDASVVVVLRHLAVPMLYNDAIWEKYGIGERTKTLDPKSKQPVTRNVYYQTVDAAGKPVENRNAPKIRPLTERGVIFIGCDLATRGFTSQIARATNQQWTDVYDEVRANLVPGATLMPTGIFGMLMAQEAGCSLLKST